MALYGFDASQYSEKATIDSETTQTGQQLGPRIEAGTDTHLDCDTLQTVPKRILHPRQQLGHGIRANVENSIAPLPAT